MTWKRNAARRTAAEKCGTTDREDSYGVDSSWHCSHKNHIIWKWEVETKEQGGQPGITRDKNDRDFTTMCECLLVGVVCVYLLGVRVASMAM